MSCLQVRGLSASCSVLALPAVWVHLTFKRNMDMTAREDLRETGTKTRQRLGLPVRKHQSSMPGLPNLVSEVVFGRVWSRPGLALDERMLATLSALTSKQYLPQLGTYLHAALSMDMSPRMLQEVMLHCAMYAGIPTAQNSLAVLDSVLEENGITVDAETLPEVDLDEMEAIRSGFKAQVKLNC